MKRLNYDGQTLVTSSAVADAVMAYAASVARMSASTAISIPVLEDNGSIVDHSLLLTSSTLLEIFDIPGDPDHEAERFPLPDLPGVGGSARPIEEDDVSNISAPIPE